MRLSISLLSDGSMTIIHAFSYGDSFTNSGLSSRSSLTSTTLPLSGAYNSETVLTDSTLPNGSSAVTCRRLLEARQKQYLLALIAQSQ